MFAKCISGGRAFDAASGQKQNFLKPDTEEEAMLREGAATQIHYAIFFSVERREAADHAPSFQE